MDELVHQSEGRAVREGRSVSETKPAVEIRLLSDPMYLAGARELVLGLTRRLGFRQDESGRIALAGVLFLVAAIGALLYLGGATGPLLPGWASTCCCRRCWTNS